MRQLVAVESGTLLISHLVADRIELMNRHWDAGFKIPLAVNVQSDVQEGGGAELPIELR